MSTTRRHRPRWSQVPRVMAATGGVRGTARGRLDPWELVRGDNGDWSEFPVGAVEFLACVYRRTVHVPGMPGDFPSDSPQVSGLSDRID